MSPIDTLVKRTWSPLALRAIVDSSVASDALLDLADLSIEAALVLCCATTAATSRVRGRGRMMARSRVGKAPVGAVSTIKRPVAEPLFCRGEIPSGRDNLREPRIPFCQRVAFFGFVLIAVVNPSDAGASGRREPAIGLRAQPPAGLMARGSRPRTHRTASRTSAPRRLSSSSRAPRS